MAGLVSNYLPRVSLIKIQFQFFLSSFKVRLMSMFKGSYWGLQFHYHIHYLSVMKLPFFIYYNGERRTWSDA